MIKNLAQRTSSEYLIVKMVWKITITVHLENDSIYRSWKYQWVRMLLLAISSGSLLENYTNYTEL